MLEVSTIFQISNPSALLFGYFICLTRHTARPYMYNYGPIKQP